MFSACFPFSAQLDEGKSSPHTHTPDQCQEQNSIKRKSVQKSHETSGSSVVGLAGPVGQANSTRHTPQANRPDTGHHKVHRVHRGTQLAINALSPRDHHTAVRVGSVLARVSSDRSSWEQIRAAVPGSLCTT